MLSPDNNLITVEDAIRHVLVRDWDPLRLQGPIVANGPYERYIIPIYQILTEHPSEEALVDYLHGMRRRELGVIGFPGTRERRAARKLLEISFHGNDKV